MPVDPLHRAVEGGQDVRVAGGLGDRHGGQAVVAQEKVNLIGHSKGGLDCRAALADPQAKAHVASLTTINTPHRGCEFADYLLNVMSNEQQQAIARSYNAAAFNKEKLVLGDDGKVIGLNEQSRRVGEGGVRIAQEMDNQ